MRDLCILDPLLSYPSTGEPSSAARKPSQHHRPAASLRPEISPPCVVSSVTQGIAYLNERIAYRKIRPMDKSFRNGIDKEKDLEQK